jgi:hypothetical protein
MQTLVTSYAEIQSLKVYGTTRTLQAFVGQLAVCHGIQIGWVHPLQALFEPIAKSQGL